MSILMVLIVALAGGDQQCRETNGLRDCNAPLLILADAGGVPMARDELTHIADVVPPSERGAKDEPPEPEPTPSSEPAAVSEPSEPALPPPSEPAAVAVAAEPSEPTPLPEPVASSGPEAVQSTAAPAPEKPWAVQVGAFGDRATAREGARRIDREGVVIVPIRRDGEDWYVVLLGSYPSYEEADSMGRAYAEDSGGSYWVRAASGLDEIRREDDPAL